MAIGSISAPGLGSSLDVAGIVEQLMSIEQQPLLRLAQREASLLSRISLFGQVKGAVSGIQTNAKSLNSLVSIASFRASSSDINIVSATATGVASAGTYPVVVSQLAQAQHVASAGQASKTDAIGAGTLTTLTISFGTISGGTFDSDTGLYSGASFAANPGKQPVAIDIDSANNTLEGIRDAINAANAGVTASIVSDGSATPFRLMIKSNDTGAANSIKLDVSGDANIQSLLAYDAAGTQNLSQLQTAQNAQLTVDGVAISSAGNSIAGAIFGLTFNLKAAGTAEISVSRDTAQIATVLGQLVKAYNDASTTVGDAVKKGATLQGDATTVNVMTRLRSELGALRSGFGAYNSLSQLGVSFQRDGSLAFDAAKLQSALSDDFTSVNALIGAFTKALGSATDGMLGAGGSLNAKTDGINRTIKDIGNRRDVLNRRLEHIEARYLAQFNALDSMIAGLRQTSTFLEQQLANLPKIGDR